MLKLMVLIACILMSYVITFILVKIGYKLDKEKKIWPVPDFIFILLFVPFLNVITAIAGLFIFLDMYKIDLKKIQNKILDGRKKK